MQGFSVDNLKKYLIFSQKKASPYNSESLPYPLPMILGLKQKCGVENPY